jgi:hypothetical protein
VLRTVAACEIVDRVIFTDRNPVLLQAVARNLQRSASLATAADGAASLADALDWLVNEAVNASADPAKLGELLEGWRWPAGASG